MSNFYNLKAELPSKKIVNFSDYKDKVVLIVNTASKCGLTPQYEWLEILHKKYKDSWLVILGFPCNQFANQEPNEETKSACLLNYWVSFPIFKQTDVNGKNTHPVFKYLKKQKFSLFGSRIKWNFTKFLISKDGTKTTRFTPTTKPEDMEKTILWLLK